MHIWAMTQYYADYAIQAELMLETPLKGRKIRQHIFDELLGFILTGCGLTLAAEPEPAQA